MRLSTSYLLFLLLFLPATQVSAKGKVLKAKIKVPPKYRSKQTTGKKFSRKVKRKHYKVKISGFMDKQGKFSSLKATLQSKHFKKQQMSTRNKKAGSSQVDNSAKRTQSRQTKKIAAQGSSSVVDMGMGWKLSTSGTMYVVDMGMGWRSYESCSKQCRQQSCFSACANNTLFK